MVVVGADVHKRTHTFVGSTRSAASSASKTVRATTTGHHAGGPVGPATFGRELLWADRGLPPSVGAARA